MFMVLSLREEVSINVMDEDVITKASYAQGMIGIIPVFETRDDAEKYACGKFDIIEVTAKSSIK